jgi:hypothetical protein
MKKEGAWMHPTNPDGDLDKNGMKEWKTW